MEFANDLLASLRGRVSPASKGGDSRRIDWLALHARLSAAHAVRRELALGESFCRGPVGSFAQGAGSVHPAAKTSQRVNLTDSTDSKAPSGIAVEVADQSRVGG